MARIPEHVIRQIKEEVSVVRLAELAGVELRPEGENLTGRCPFHEDEGSSLLLSPTENAWRCSGECEAGGSAIEWTMRAEGVSFPHAVELLRGGALPSTPRSQRATRSTVAKLPPLLPQGAEERELLERVVDFYAQTLHESPEALAYLRRRGLGDPELIKHFRLGYANRTLGYRLPAKNRKAGAELRGKLKSLGILRDSGHEHLSGSLVIPLCEEDGKLTQLYGRKVQRALRAGTTRHLYLPGPRGIFNVAALGARREAIVCESPIDALTFWGNGLRNVAATPGPEECGEELCAALAAVGVERTLIAFDADEEGERGAEALADRLAEPGIECLRVRFPDGEDANSFACTAEDPAAALARLVREAEPGETSPPAAEAEPEAPVEPLSWEEPEQPDVAEPAALAPVPPPAQASAVSPAIEADGEELRIGIEERRWRVRGLGKTTSFESLRVNVLVARERPRRGEVFHLDTLDLYSARSRASFAGRRPRSWRSLRSCSHVTWAGCCWPARSRQSRRCARPRRRRSQRSS